MIEDGNIITELGALSYAGIWIVGLLSNMIIPVPEEVVLLALGYLAGTGSINIAIVIPLIISGLLLSDVIVYSLAKKGSSFITWIYTKFFSKYLKYKNQDWFDAHMGKIIFFSRFMIQLRFIGPFLAGQKKLPLRTFVKYDLLALVIYVPLYLFLGLFFHSRIKSIIDNVGVIKNSILIIFGILIIFTLFKSIYRYIFGPKN